MVVSVPEVGIAWARLDLTRSVSGLRGRRIRMSGRLVGNSIETSSCIAWQVEQGLKGGSREFATESMHNISAAFSTNMSTTPALLIFHSQQLVSKVADLFAHGTINKFLQRQRQQ